MHGRQINPYDISHFVRCNTLVLISITHAAYNAIMRFTCNKKKLEGGVAVCVCTRCAGGRRGRVSVYRSGSCSVMYTENLAIYVISVCDFNQRQSWPRSCRKITQHLLAERERGGTGYTTVASGRSLSPRRVSNFLAPFPPTKSVYGSSLIKEHHKSVARAIVIMNLISIRAFI